MEGWIGLRAQRWDEKNWDMKKRPDNVCGSLFWFECEKNVFFGGGRPPAVCVHLATHLALIGVVRVGGVAPSIWSARFPSPRGSQRYLRPPATTGSSWNSR